jgi:hypothetical protein
MFSKASNLVLTRLLERVFQDLKFDFVYHYLDDLVIYSERFESHLEHIRLVLDRLRMAGLTIKPEKFVFATQELWGCARATLNIRYIIVVVLSNVVCWIL